MSVTHPEFHEFPGLTYYSACNLTSGKHINTHPFGQCGLCVERLFRFFRPQRKVVKLGKGLLDCLERLRAHFLCKMYSLGHVYN